MSNIHTIGIALDALLQHLLIGIAGSKGFTFCQTVKPFSLISASEAPIFSAFEVLPWHENPTPSHIQNTNVCSDELSKNCAPRKMRFLLSNPSKSTDLNVLPTTAKRLVQTSRHVYLRFSDSIKRCTSRSKSETMRCVLLKASYSASAFFFAAAADMRPLSGKMS